VTIAIGYAEGKMGDSGKMRYVSVIFYETNLENRLAFLNHLVGVNEFEVDASAVIQEA
jgi:hypothetical protein